MQMEQHERRTRKNGATSMRKHAEYHEMNLHVLTCEMQLVEHSFSPVIVQDELLHVLHRGGLDEDLQRHLLQFICKLPSHDFFVLKVIFTHSTALCSGSYVLKRAHRPSMPAQQQEKTGVQQEGQEPSLRKPSCHTE